MTDGKKQIPFATELESGKWLHDSDMCAHLPQTSVLCDPRMFAQSVVRDRGLFACVLGH